MYLVDADTHAQLATLAAGDNVSIGITDVGSMSVAYVGTLADVLVDGSTVALSWAIRPGVLHRVRFNRVPRNDAADAVVVALVPAKPDAQPKPRGTRQDNPACVRIF